jgi:small subunit ribosomal protein S11
MLKQQKNYHLIKNKTAILLIQSSFNNIIINIIVNNKMISCKSCGNKTIKGAQRHSLYAIQVLLEDIKKKLNSLNIKFLKIYFKGINFKNYHIIKQLFNFKILKIINITNTPHNGCRLSKKKRR